VVCFTSRPLYPEERIPGTHWIGDCVGPRLCMDAVIKRTTELMRAFGQLVNSAFEKYLQPSLEYIHDILYDWNAFKGRVRRTTVQVRLTLRILLGTQLGPEFHFHVVDGKDQVTLLLLVGEWVSEVSWIERMSEVNVWGEWVSEWVNESVSQSFSRFLIVQKENFAIHKSMLFNLRLFNTALSNI